jgi:general secretion pathway protein G
VAAAVQRLPPPSPQRAHRALKPWARGFTLIEMVVTVAVVAVLAAIAVPVQVTSQRAKESELRLALRQIREGIDTYKHSDEADRPAGGRQRLPAQPAGAGGGVPDARAPGKGRIHVRRLPRDPFSPTRRRTPPPPGACAATPARPTRRPRGGCVRRVFSRARCRAQRLPYRER